MKKMKNKSSSDIINDLLTSYSTSREFARAIKEDPADIVRWRSGRSPVKPRAVIQICRLYPEIKPNSLNPIFPEDIYFEFKDTK